MEPFLSAGPGIDVDEIMAGIRRRIEERRRAGAFRDEEIQAIAGLALQPLPDFLEIPDVYEPHLYPPPAGDPAGDEAPADLAALRGEIRALEQTVSEPQPHETLSEVQETGSAKKLLAAVRRLLFPLIRFFSRPLYNELKRDLTGVSNRCTDQANQLQHARLASAHARLAAMETLLDLMRLRPVVAQSREYIKLLHHVATNSIAEITRLRAEVEMLKTRIRVVEEKTEFVENRERALEKRLDRE